MSELINKNDNRATIRWKLLTGASALALTVSSASMAKAEDKSQPQIWVELGGQLSGLQDDQETFAPPLMDGRPTIFAPSQKFEKPPLYSIDEEGRISFQPDDSNWVFSASIRYGRSKSSRHHLQQTNPGPTSFAKYSGAPTYLTNPIAQRFAETKASNGEHHAVLDFEAGKDVGLGIFGNSDSSSLISIGIRIAQFSSKSNFALKSDPDWHFAPKYVSNPYLPRLEFMRQAFHSNLASMTAERRFHGIGPSVSWKSSVPVAGNIQDGEIEADWGINGAILFGRQRARTHHQSTERYRPGTKYAQNAGPRTVSRLPATPDHARSRNVTVPNIGGAIGLSWRLQDFKVSFGYRADFFFNAMDGGIDARKNENRSFFGPFASISVGLGD